MKKIILSLLLCFSSISLFAHIDRPIDALIFDGKTYDTYSQPLSSYVKGDRNLKRKLLTNPVNPRLPKHYYATFEIKDNKLYLNKIEIIVISEAFMRKWRIPLAVTYGLKPLEASELFGKGASYPVFCDWYSGNLFSTIFEGERDLRYLFSDNYSFEIKNGEYLGKSTFSTRTILSKYVSFEEANLIPKFFKDKSFGMDNRLFDLRCINNPRLLGLDEFNLIRSGQPFKTRGYLSVDGRDHFSLTLPKTHKTEVQSLSLFNKLGHDVSGFKSGDRVEATLFYHPNTSKLGLLNLSHLEEDDLIHSPDFFLRQ